MDAIQVFVGEYGEYAIPPAVIQKAEEINGGKRLTDRRTRGSKFIERWGRKQDSMVRTSKWLDEVIQEQTHV